MKQEEQRTIPSEKWGESVAAMHWVVAGSSIGAIAVFATIGYYIDVAMDTKPIFLALGVIGSFILSQIVIIRQIKSHTKKLVNKK